MVGAPRDNSAPIMIRVLFWHARVDGEGAHAVEGRGFPIDGAGGRPGGAPGELVLADLIRGQRGGRAGE